MARIPDREDRATAAKASARPKKKVVKRRPKPMPVPDMAATMLVPHQPVAKPKAQPKSIVVKRVPSPRPLPTPFERQSMVDVMLPAKPGSLRDRQIKGYNQDVEAQRRAEAAARRAAQKERRAEVRRMDPYVRSTLGKERLDRYIREGASPSRGSSVSRAVGAAAGAVGDVIGGLDDALAERIEGAVTKPMRPRQPAPFGGATAQTISGVGRATAKGAELTSDVALGPNITKLISGEDYDPKWLIAELALLPLPLRGLPTPVTAVLRTAVGAKRLAAGERAGLTVAEMLGTPVREARAASRASLVAKAAGATGPVPSSRIAGALAGKGQGRIARAIRNDVRATRKFTVGDATVETAADLSRTGKAVRAAMDRIRDLPVVPLRSTETLFARQVGKQAVKHLDRAAGLEKALQIALPKHLLHMDWPGIYAVRTVAKGVPIEDAIRVTERNMLEAKAAGNWLEEQANKAHLGFFKSAQKYVTTSADGQPVFTADAPPQLSQLREALENVSLERESIVRGLDKLSDETMKGRILNEQLYYAEARALPKDDWIAQALQAHPIRQKLAALWAKHHPEQADAGLMLIDANARRVYQERLAEIDGEIARLRAAIERNPMAPQNARHRRDIEKLEVEAAHTSPADFFNEISDVADVLPANIADEISKSYGQQDVDWRFSMYDSEDEVAAASRRMADEIIAEGLPLPPEWSTRDEIAEGIHNVFKLARDGEAGKDWYQEAADGVQMVADVTGEDPRKVAQLFAIYSQAADTIANATFVFRAIREWQTYGDIFAGRFPTRQSAEALAVMKGEPWEGRKRSSFYANILRHMPGQEGEYAHVIKEMADARGAPITHPVTVDRWVVRMFRPDAKKDVPEKFYDTFEGIMQKMGAHVGWEPEQVQAAAWVTTKQQGFDREIAEAGGKVKGTLSARLAAGSEDAFQYGIRKNIERWNEPVSEVTPQMNRLANQANKKWGGFTVDRDLQPVPEEGYSVSYSLTERAFKLHGLKGSDIARFRDDYAEMLKDKAVRIGGFSDDANDAGDGTELTLLSITRHFKSKAAAMKFAREQGQETVYEYKTGDGIRTGLTREEQGEIIRNLDRAHLKGGPVTDLMPLTPDAQKYRDFLDKAAVELGNAKPGKKVSDAARSRTEQWLSRHAAEFPEEPLIDEWYDLTMKASEVDEPPWMLPPAPSAEAATFQSEVAQSQLHYNLFDDAGGTQPGAEEFLLGKGAVAAREFPGYDQAIRDLESGVLPTDFIEAVYNSPLHIYDKTAIGRHLDSLSQGQLKGRKFPGIPGAEAMFPEMLTLAGLWEASSRGLYFSERSHPIDWIHEFTHVLETTGMFPPAVRDRLWSHVGAAPGAKLTHDQSEDVADMVTSVLLGFDAAKSDLPADLKQALTEMRHAATKGGRSMWREKAALEKLPEEERIFLEDIFRFAEEEGVFYTNGFVPKTGQYVPEKQGMPFRFGTINPLAPRRAASIWLRLLSGKRVVNLTPTDKHLTHEFKGALLGSGLFEKNVIEGPLDGLMKAFHLQRMDEVHRTMVSAGRPVPESADDVMIPIDPKAWTDKTRAQARNVIEILNTMDTGGTVDKMALDRVDAQAIEAIKDFMFPGMTDGTAARVADIARQAMQQPIDGVVWVDRNLLLKTGLFAPTATKTPAMKYVIGAVDDLNNILKMATLSLNPAYYPMNMAGQSIMLASQLGFSAPFSLARSLRMAGRLSEEDLALVDRFADIGYAGSLLSKGGALKNVTDAVGKVGTILIDKYPRRMSFLHEARRIGYKTEEEIHGLLNDPDKFDDLMRVHERVQRGMVDYGNLNRFEKEWLTRLIFVYPWLRGSSRYAAQFPFDHPIQASLFAGLVYYQQNRMREAFPEGHPGYLKWYMPISQEPGENPFGFRMDQLATPLQTLDLAAMMAYWVTGGEAALPWGSNEEGVGSMLGPLAEEIEKTVTGWDSFTQEEVSHGIPQLFSRILDPRERWASWKRLEKVMNHETHKGLYDTTQTQNWLRLFLGSLAPINVDVEKAGEMTAAARGTPSAEQSREAYIEKIEKANGKPLTDEEVATITQWKLADQTYRKVSREYRDEHEIEGDSTIQERAAMLLLTVGEINPAVKEETERRAVLALEASDEEAQAAYDELRVALGLKQLGTLDGRVRKAQLAQRTKS